MFIVTRGVKKSDVPSSGGTLATIAGSAGAAKIPLQILNFTQNVTGTITIPASNTYGYLVCEMGSYDIDGNGSACFTNNNSFDITINGSGDIDSGSNGSVSESGSGTDTDVGSQGLDIAVASSTSGYTTFSTTITQGNSGFSGGQASGNWNVIRENAGSGTGTWTAKILNANVSLSGSSDKKSLSVTKNGNSEVSLGNNGGSWGPISCVPGDTIVWTCSAGAGGGGTINRSQSWSWTGSGFKIMYTTNTNGGTSGAFSSKTITLTNNNTDGLSVTLNSGTTGISTDTVVAASGGTQTLQAAAVGDTDAWVIAATIPSQTVSGTIYSGTAAFDGTGVTTSGAGVPSDGIVLTGFTGNYNRVI